MNDLSPEHRLLVCADADPDGTAGRTKPTMEVVERSCRWCGRGVLVSVSMLPRVESGVAVPSCAQCVKVKLRQAGSPGRIDPEQIPELRALGLLGQARAKVDGLNRATRRAQERWPHHGRPGRSTPRDDAADPRAQGNPPANPASPDSESLATFRRNVDANEARVRRLCAGQPQQAAVRKVLLGLEKTVHLTDGWDAPPRLFALSRNEHSGRIIHLPAVKLTEGLHERAACDGGDYTQALLALSLSVEWLRHQVDPSSVDPGPLEEIQRTPELLSYIEAARQHPDLDLVRLSPGQVFHGIGFLMEGYWKPVSDDESGLSEDLESSPYSFENRIVLYAGRDGFLWEVMRFRRRADGVTMPRHCRVFDPDAAVGGVAAMALSRICNGIASNPVPIRGVTP